MRNSVPSPTSDWIVHDAYGGSNLEQKGNDPDKSEK